MGIRLLVCFLFACISFSAPIVISLNGKWFATNANKSISVNAQVPGQIHTDLIRAGIIGDPYYRFNDVDYAWVAQDSWTYTTTFNVDASVPTLQHISLVAEGLDTIATVTVNGKVVGKSDNQFRTYFWNLAGVLVAGTNSIIVTFQSAISYGLQQSQACPIDIPPDCPPDVQNGFCHINFIRKEPCSFSWDWGPAYAPQGIWKDIYIQAYNDSTIRAVQVATLKNPFGGWDLDVNVHIHSAQAVSGSLLVSLQPLYQPNQPPPTQPIASISLPIQLQAGGNDVELGLAALRVLEWMPTGYGDANLYPLDLTLTINGYTSSSKSIRVGFRTVRLVQDPLPGGTSFYFEVNGVPIFMKGANWIPADAFESRVTTDVLRDQLISCKEANMNTLRVWGGGVYQQDAFYDLADELGLLIWQEFIFACALYPTDADFLNNIAAEVKDQLLRLQWHPSIILWSGNNENEVAIADNWYGVSNKTLFIDMYEQLYFETVLANLTLWDTTRPTLSSSPSNGDESASNPVETSPNSVWKGDVHYYNYDLDCWDVSTYPRPRFASEYGFQSFPSFISLESVSNGSLGDWDFYSPFTLHRQHHEGGNDQIMTQIKYHYPLPNSQDATKLYKDTLWMSQVMHAQCIKTESEHYRRIRSECNENESGCTMGTLYWQANDIWQGASWASLEYGGRWKVLQYFTKKFYASVIASMYNIQNNVGLYVVNDLTVPVSGTVKLSMFSWSSLTPLNQWSQPFSIGAGSAASVYSSTFSSLLSQGNCPQATQCVLSFETFHSNGTKLSDNYFFLSNLQDVTNFQNPNFKISNIALGTPNPEYANTFVITIMGQAPAPFVWLETAIQGHFSDNGFLYTGSPSSVLFYTRDPTVTITSLTTSLAITSLWNINH